MNTQKVMPIITINGVEYGIYRSEFIKGQRSVLRQTADFCLKDKSLLEFWRSAVKAISGKPDCDQDGVIYTSEEMDVFLGPWSIDIRHDYKWTEKPGGDTYMGISEPYAELQNSFEVVGAYDVDNDESLPGIVYVLNAYYKNHQQEIFKIQ